MQRDVVEDDLTEMLNERYAEINCPQGKTWM